MGQKKYDQFINSYPQHFKNPFNRKINNKPSNTSSNVALEFNTPNFIYHMITINTPNKQRNLGTKHE